MIQLIPMYVCRFNVQKSKKSGSTYHYLYSQFPSSRIKENFSACNVSFAPGVAIAMRNFYKRFIQGQEKYYPSRNKYGVSECYRNVAFNITIHLFHFVFKAKAFKRVFIEMDRKLGKCAFEIKIMKILYLQKST